MAFTGLADLGMGIPPEDCELLGSHYQEGVLPAQGEADVYRACRYVIGEVGEVSSTAECGEEKRLDDGLLTCIADWCDYYEQPGGNYENYAVHFDAALRFGQELLTVDSELFWIGMRMMGFERTEEGKFLFVPKARDMIFEGYAPRAVSDLVFYRLQFPDGPPTLVRGEGSEASMHDMYLNECRRQLGM